MTEPKRGANPYEDISKRTTDHHPKLGLMIGGAVAAVVAIIAQRLVRRLCPSCKTPYSPDAAERALLGAGPDAIIYKPSGCGRCGQSGYEGRVGTYELIVADDTLRRLIHDNAGEQELAAHAFRRAESLAQCGFNHVLAGMTSLEEVLRVVRLESEDAGV